MAQITLGGNPVNTSGELPAVGSTAPAFTLTGGDMSPVSSADFAGQRVVLSIFPSIGTGTCQTAARTFNERAAALDNTVVVCASADLPFAAAQFCGAEGLDDVVTGSSFKSPEFGTDYGVRFADGKFEGLLARAVVVIDESGSVVHSQLVSEVADEPDYDAAIASLG